MEGSKGVCFMWKQTIITYKEILQCSSDSKHFCKIELFLKILKG